jgi:ferredoxin/flavodoxin---NADP+ reductase
MNATIAGRDDLSPTVARFRVAPDDGVPAFVPGQYFALGLPDGERLVQRPYSTASPGGARIELEFLIRLVSGGAFTPRLWALSVGGRLRLGRPKGLFALRQDDGRSRLFLATGTGLAPFVSMLGTMLAGGPDGSRPARVVVAHGVSRCSELAYQDRLRGWAQSRPEVGYVPVISRPGHPENAAWLGPAGRLEAILDATCAQYSLGPRDTVAYLCGNPEMIAACTARLTVRGFPTSAIVSEQYWTSGRGTNSMQDAPARTPPNQWRASSTL